MYQTWRTKTIDLEREYWTASMTYIAREWNLCLKSRKHLKDANESFTVMNALCRFSFWDLWAQENSVNPRAPILTSGTQSSLRKHTQIQYGCWVHRRLSNTDSSLPFNLFHVFNVNYYKIYWKDSKGSRIQFYERTELGFTHMLTDCPQTL